jgi:uncharacterized protein (DUF362 family)/Pyruvate/2-oxoacid:ferredoxin oxidoreductase delta subunit
MEKVAILQIDNYEASSIRNKLEKILSRYFSLEDTFSKNNRVLLKPNLLMSSLPEEAITTHPVFIEAVGRIFQDKGCSVFIADSPGGFADKKDIDYVYEATGVKEISKRYGFGLLYPTETVILDEFPFCWWVNSFEIINLPKLKSHQLTTLTLAVKNLYGCISGLYKSHLHKVYPRTNDFIEVLIKVYKKIKPRLNIVDGILSLEGDGPAKNGRPKKLGIVVIGSDALYTDYVIGKLLGLDVDSHPIVKKAKEVGLFREDNVEIISERDFSYIDFKLSSPSIVNYIPLSLISLFRLFLKFRPAIDKKKCKGCNLCIKICPKQAIKIKDNKRVIDYKKCIVCMCCAEVCQFGAVDLKKSILLRLLDGLL